MLICLVPEAVVQRCSVKKGPTTLSKKRLWHSCFPVNFAKFPRVPFSYRTPLVAASVVLRLLNNLQLLKISIYHYSVA